MLKNIDPLLGPEFLAVLRAMGHGDEVALVDANYPAGRNARQLIRCDGHDLIRVLNAVLSVLPVDTFDGAACFTMAPVDDGASTPEAISDIDALLNAHGEADSTQLERFDFYARSRNCYAIVATGERRLYGNIILRKGVIEP